MNDKYDILEEKFCAVLSAIAQVPRKKCDELFTLASHGALPIQDMSLQMEAEFGHDNVNTAKAVMKIVNNSGRTYEQEWLF